MLGYNIDNERWTVVKSQVRKRTELENGEVSNEESIDSLDKQLAESKFTLAASESKFDDISRLVFMLSSTSSLSTSLSTLFQEQIWGNFQEACHSRGGRHQGQREGRGPYLANKNTADDNYGDSWSQNSRT